MNFFGIDIFYSILDDSSFKKKLQILGSYIKAIKKFQFRFIYFNR